jgi:RNA polymerase sigma-70 factor (ECF subfamily)
MANPPLSSLLRLLRERLLGSRLAAEVADGELLARFARQRDEAASTALLLRHGPMVLGVCRRALGHAQDAEGAIQATFLLLARR